MLHEQSMNHISLKKIGLDVMYAGLSLSKPAVVVQHYIIHSLARSGVLTKMGGLKGPTPPSLLTAATSME